MPILDIEVVGQLEEIVSAGLASRLADRIGSQLQSKPGSTWVKIRYLPESQYAENARESLSSENQPVFVSILMADLPEVASDRSRLIRVVTEAIAVGIQRSKSNIHVVLQPAARGRIAFGGDLAN
ncbi:hypothetical protein [Thiolapillus sp.]